MFAYVFDQLTKIWVTATMVEGERIAVLPPLLHWYFIRNSGAAFSIGENVTWVFSIIMAGVAIAILFQVRKLGSAWWALALGLLLGGALGNLTDRLFREPSFGMGHVVDFIQLPNFAIFNIADSAVVSAVSIICILTLRGIALDGSRHVAAPQGKGRGCLSAWWWPRNSAEARDAGLARLMGISRSLAATLIAEGNVVSRGKKVGKSARLRGDVLEVTVPERRDPLEVVEEVVEGLKILLDDDDFVVVDKPVGVAAHPSPGWVGPTVVGGLAGAGYRISTSGSPERVGIVHRLDVGTSGVMVVAKTERAYTALKRAFKERTVDKVYHAVVQGLPDPLEGTIDAPIGRHPGPRLALRGYRGRPAVDYALRGPGSLRQGHPGGSAPGNGPHPSDPCALCGPAPPLRR